MAELRWVLLAAALLALAGIFVWTRHGHWVRERLPRLRRGLPRLRPRREPVLHPDAETGSAPATVAGESAQAPRAEVPADFSRIVTIRLLCRQRPGFPAEQLILALREAGLRHGRYGIFHRMDDGGDSRFSVANLVEPGSFDLTRIRSDHYPGISLFMMADPGSAPVSAFDDMVATARELARQLGGELVDEQGSTLSIQRERYLREELIQLEHRPGLHG